jgi:NDP-sugar pyrophosphorylase family protein
MSRSEVRVMIWYRVDGPTASKTLKAMKSYSRGGVQVVRQSSTRFWIGVGEGHKWTDDISRDFGVHLTESDEPGYLTATCGVCVVSSGVIRHESRCKSCRSVLSQKSTCKNSDVKTLFSVDGLSDISLDGMISVLQQKRDEALHIAEEMDSLVQALTSVDDLDNQLLRLQEQRAEQQKALNYFLK